MFVTPTLFNLPSPPAPSQGVGLLLPLRHLVSVASDVEEVADGRRVTDAAVLDSAAAAPGCGGDGRDCRDCGDCGDCGGRSGCKWRTWWREGTQLSRIML